MLNLPHLPTESDPLRAAVKAGDFSQVIRLARRRTGLTQQQLGNLVGYSISTISRLESGRQPLHDITTLRRLADALNIPCSWIGLADQPTASGRAVSDPPPAILGRIRVKPSVAGEDQTVKRRQFLTVAGSTLLGAAGEQPAEAIVGHLEHLLINTTDAAPVPLTSLATQVNTAQATLAASRYGALSTMLPPLVATATTTAATATGHQQERAHKLLSDAYNLAAELATKIHTGGGLAWVAADRALRAAQLSGDVVAVAQSSRQVAIAMRRQGRHASATDLLTHTASSLNVDTGHPAPSALTAYTKLLCTAAYSSAQAGARHQATDYISEAERAARRLAAHPEPSPSPVPATVAVYQIGVYNALGEPGTALEHAEHVDARLLPTPERYARYCIDTARAWHAAGNRDQAVNALLAAESAAPEEVRRPSVSALISTMRYAPGPVSASLQALASRACV